MDPIYDLAIIGGGINGCGCAADASLRGLKVVLFEESDIASKTSSKSTKLIHGGLRYLEYFDFSMVKKSLSERQLLLQLAPHLVHPLPFFLPYHHHSRSTWMIRAGLFLYDHLSSKNTLPKAKAFNREARPNYFSPLIKDVNRGFLFYDCATDDARLTLANAKQAQEHGCDVYTRTKIIDAALDGTLWKLTAQDKHNNTVSILAKSLINAAGPWVELVNALLKIPSKYPMTLVKGSHVVVSKLYEGEQAYFLQHKDNRVIFVIPYYGKTMIGTTDVAIDQSLKDELQITDAEVHYLCDAVNHYFKKTIQASDIIHSWSGIRPLLASTGKNLRELSRDYTYYYTQQPAPAVVLCGGKITTYRQLALQAVDQLKKVFPNLAESKTWYTPLPGAFLQEMPFQKYQFYAHGKYHWLNGSIRSRLLNTYGTRMENFLDPCGSYEDLGVHFGHGLYQVEVDHLLQEEWAETVDDILWRRTKLGLEMSREQQNVLQNYLDEH